MTAAPSGASRTRGIAAKRRQATPAVAPVYASVFNYRPDVRAGLPRAFRCPKRTTYAKGDRK
jgi:hypothetical protein